MKLGLKEAGLQTFVLTNRNQIRGCEVGCVSTSLLSLKHFKVNTKTVCLLVSNGKKMFLLGQVSITTNWYNREVRIGHSTIANELHNTAQVRPVGED
jgi:hypothetical protein